MKEDNWWYADHHNKNTDFHKWYKIKYSKTFPYTTSQLHLMSRNISGSKRMNQLIAVLDKYYEEFSGSLFNSPVSYTITDEMLE